MRALTVYMCIRGIYVYRLFLMVMVVTLISFVFVKVVRIISHFFVMVIIRRVL